jgi:hypothetical protein
MVRRGMAIERLLWVLAVAYALVVLTLSQRTLRAVRRQALAVLKGLSVVGAAYWCSGIGCTARSTAH